ncbi:Holliday junction branch migration protein RuvA [Leucobacter alluvii]|uniref:Holliday junction branch migration complex subunit RuvA n=1 Tax=Leucobacter alluvii TaxID=340321 RepID=A0ABP5MW79_9MICO
MIASIRGPVLAAGAGWVVVELGGLGMRVEVPSGRAAAALPGDELRLQTSLIVREDSLTLFGFATEAELDVFGHLIAVSGVGPRSALGVLSALTPAEIAAAVAADDEKPFRKVSGIGPKTAKLITLSLSGKLSHLAFESGPAAAGIVSPSDAIADGVRAGLVGLGWGEAEAGQAVQDARDAGASDDSAGLLRAALALLQAGRSGRGSRGVR